MEEKKYLNLEMLALYDALIKQFVDSKIFIGTCAEYKTADANNLIPLNTLVILTDDETSTEDWESPIQNNDELIITQSYIVAHQDNVLEVE